MRINGFPAPRYEIRFHEDGHWYEVPGLVPPPSVTGVINALDLGFSPRLPSEALEAARERGRYVHGCALLRASDDLDVSRVAPEYAGWVEAMLAAYRELRLRPALAEEPLYCPVYRYAGTLDFYGHAPEIVRPPAAVLIEWKTGDDRGVDMQLGAQANLLRANYPDLGPLDGYVVHLSQRGTWWAERKPWEEGWEDFAAARRLYARLQRRRKE